MLYQKDILGLYDLLPFSGYLISENERLGKKLSLGSIFFRYLLKESNAEIYGEYGRNDRAASIINLLTDDNYNRGYIFGFKKILKKSYFNFKPIISIEATQLDASKPSQIYNAQSWYTHDYVRHGYTNLGKYLGASIGPGSNSQSLDLSFLRGNTYFGVMMERLVHNNDFFYNAYYPLNDWKRHWVDMSSFFHFQTKLYNNAFLKATFGITRSMNYEYREVLVDPLLPGNGFDPINLFSNVILIYNW
jgi:hypothetical protein